MRLTGALLEGRTALVTGAGGERGLGRAVARLLAAHGARVLVTDIDGEGAARTAAELGEGHAGMAHDIASAEDCAAAVARAVELGGGLDVVVNSAGVTSPARLLDIDEGERRRVIAINLEGTILMTQAAVPAMGESGSIVHISSVAGQRGGGIFGGSHYAAAKAGVVGYAKAAARELAPRGIRVNAICPSYVETDITAGMSDEQRAAVVGAVPMGRGGTPDDVAGAALFLASDLSAYVTGATIDVNGGSHIH